MSVVTQEMILEYMRRKGGRVKNVDLVKHFRKHLSFEDKTKKEQAREMFKETVNSVAVIRQEEGEKFLYLRDEHISNNHHSQQNHTSPPRTPLQPVVQQSPTNRVQTQPHPSTTSPTSRVPNTQQQQQQRTALSNNQGRPTELSSNQGRPTDLSSNQGRPTDLSNGRHSLAGTSSPQPPVSPTRVTRPSSSMPYQYQNGTSDFTKPEEKSFVPKQKSPVPLPKPTDRSSPQRGTSPSPHPQTPNRGVLPPHQSPNIGVPSPHQSPQRSISPNPAMGKTQENKPITNSPRILSPPRSHSSSPRAMPSPRHNGITDPTLLGSTPTRANNRHRPDSSSSFNPITQSPSRHARQPPAPPSSSQQPRLISQSTVPNFSQSHSSASGRGNSNAKKRIEISGPMSVTALSNGPSVPTSAQFVPGGLNQSIPYGSPSHSVHLGATPISQSLDDKHLSSMLEHYTSELENIGGSSPFTTPHSLMNVGSLGDQSHRDVPIATTSSYIGSSENSSLSSTSAQSTHSPPPVDISSAPNHPKLGHKISQTGAVGVQRLIQQYTVPPGAVVPVSPTTDPVLLSPTRVGRSSSSISNQSSGSNVVFRRQETPPDGSKVQRSQSNAATSIQHRRSRLVERNSNLDTLTRQSIKGTHKLHRQSKTSDELIPTSSREELLSNEDHDRDSPVNEREDEFTYDIDPMEREWVQALINANMTEMNRIMMTDNTIIDKRSFLHGWSALHWAVKSSNEDIIRSLMVSGAKVDIRSNGGLTPLHIAAECGNEKVIRMLVYDYNASTNIRDHSGRRPVDVVHPFAPETMRTTLRIGLDDVPFFRNQSLTIAMGSVKPSGMGPTANAFHIPRAGTQSAATLRRNWNSTGHLIDNQIPDKGTLRRSQLSPRVARKGFSFRRKKYQVNVNNKRDSGQAEYYHERKDS